MRGKDNALSVNSHWPSTSSTVLKKSPNFITQFFFLLLLFFIDSGKGGLLVLDHGLLVVAKVLLIYRSDGSLYHSVPVVPLYVTLYGLDRFCSLKCRWTTKQRFDRPWKPWAVAYTAQYSSAYTSFRLNRRYEIDCLRVKFLFDKSSAIN